jgi:hypothetical protein
MAKLDPKNFKMALREAARMREANEDPYFLATSLLNQNFRVRQLETVANLAEQLLQDGSSDELLEQLEEALQAIRGGTKKKAA